MQNIIICKNCSAINPYFNLTCQKCSAYLREKVFNIDIWNIQWQLIESPVNAIKRIVFAEHKNIMLISLFLISIKMIFNILMTYEWLSNKSLLADKILSLMTYSFFGFPVFLLIVTLITKSILILFKNETKLKDIFAVNIFSHFPYIYGLIFILPIEILIFGSNIFTKNPSAFFIDQSTAIILSIFEMLIILYSVFLFSISGYVFTKSKVFAVIYGTGMIIFTVIFFYISSFI